MHLTDIINRQRVPEPWGEGEKIPWNEPGFSRRMLQEHLTQAHDLASRRFETIDRHVAWIHTHILKSQITRILDLGCGPGLYTNRLSRLGHDCTGIDFSPASIEYAIEQAGAENPDCRYRLEDIRAADYGGGYGLVMLIFGEFNVFRPGDARTILAKARKALEPGGILLLEAHTFAAVQRTGEEPPSWYSSKGGLFSERPHLCLMESFWDAEKAVSTERYFVINAETGEVNRCASSMQAYTEEGYSSLLEEVGFGEITFHPSLHGEADVTQEDFLVVTAR